MAKHMFAVSHSPERGGNFYSIIELQVLHCRAKYQPSSPQTDLVYQLPPSHSSVCLFTTRQICLQFHDLHGKLHDAEYVLGLSVTYLERVQKCQLIYAYFNYEITAQTYRTWFQHIKCRILANVW